MNTLKLRQVRPGLRTMTCGTLSDGRRRAEDRALAFSGGLPVIAHDIDYPRADVLGPVHGELRLHVYHDGMPVADVLAAQRILDLGGTIWTPIRPRTKWDGPRTEGQAFVPAHRAKHGDGPWHLSEPFLADRFSDARWRLPGRDLDPALVDEVLG